MRKPMIDIALAADHGYFCGLLVTAISMARHASRDAALRFNVLDGGLTDDDWSLLREKLQDGHPDVTVRRLAIDESRYASFPAWHCGSRMAYAWLELADRVEDADFAIYCDVDFLWQADVAELWALRDSSVVLQGYPDGWALTCERECAWHAKQGLPFSFERYVCSGLLIINLSRYRQEKLTAQVMGFLSRYTDVPYVDQTALNAVVKKIGLLPRKWHRFSRDLRPKELSDECALHFAGDLPWRCDWRAQPLNDAIIAWHRFYGELMGVGAWQSLRMCFSLREIVLRRLLDKIVRSRLLRGAFFGLLRLLRHDGCLPYYRDRRMNVGTTMASADAQDSVGRPDHSAGVGLRILYDDRGMRDAFGGVSRYFAELMRNLPDGFEWILPMSGTMNIELQTAPFDIPKGAMDVGGFVRGFLGGRAFPGVRILYRALARLFPCRFPSVELANERLFDAALREGNFDVVHLTDPHPRSVYWRKAVGVKPIVVTVHDLIPETMWHDRKVRRARRRMLADATRIIAVSESTKGDLVKLYHVPEERIAVVHHGCGGVRPSREDVKRAGILYVGRRGGYKNFDWFVRAVAPLLNEKRTLFCTGEPFTAKEQSLLSELGVSSYVRHEFVVSFEMDALFERMDVFVCPSLAEGFGLPIVDAFAAGCPVVLPDNSCFPEVGGEAALYFRAGDDEGLRRRILEAEARQAELAARGRARVQSMTWARCAAETAKIYAGCVRRDSAGNGLAVLVASHNRREMTLECLRSLGSFRGKVFLVDGGSSDGTADAVEREFPHARVIRRGPDIWWASGMRIAWETAAAEGGWDAYLWLNDDVRLDAGALEELTAATDGRTVVAGMLREPGTDIVSYASDDLGLKRIPSARKVDICGFLHGNCVLVPAQTYAEFGGIASQFIHNFADMEFGERVRRKGVRLVAVGSVGECARTPAYDRRLFLTMSLAERLKAIRDPKRIAAKDWISFKRLTRGWLWAVLSAIKMGLLVLCPRLVVRR